MQTSKAIAIVGIWLGVGIACFATESGVLGFFFAFITTAIISRD